MTQYNPGLGEQALNKMAQIALSSQLEEAEKLHVQVKVDPNNLAKGEVDSLDIEGEGLVMQQDLRMQELNMHINSIAVNPLTAMFGKIELTKATEGTARVVLTEDDITTALNSDAIIPHLRQIEVRTAGNSVNIDMQKIECSLLANGKIALNASVVAPQTGENHQISFTTIPQVSISGQDIVFQDVQYAEGGEIAPQLTAALLERLCEILNLRYFEMEGITLRIHQINVEKSQLTLFAEALVTQFPKA